MNNTHTTTAGITYGDVFQVGIEFEVRFDGIGFLKFKNSVRRFLVKEIRYSKTGRISAFIECHNDTTKDSFWTKSVKPTTIARTMWFCAGIVTEDWQLLGWNEEMISPVQNDEPRHDDGRPMTWTETLVECIERLVAGGYDITPFVGRSLDALDFDEINKLVLRLRAEQTDSEL